MGICQIYKSNTLRIVDKVGIFLEKCSNGHVAYTDFPMGQTSVIEFL